jgi:hypothetical protein
MFRQRQQLRRWAFRVLMVWLFGLGLGVANACLAAAQFEPGPSATSLAVPAPGATQGLLPQSCDHHAAARGDSASDAEEASSKSNCESFCERTSLSIPPQKSVFGDLEPHALPPVVLASAQSAAVNAPVLRWVPRRDGVRPQPILITFLRLAL